MPFRKDLLVVAGRLGRRLTATVLPSLAPGLALADHGVPAPTGTGIGGMWWLLVAGAVVAVSLAAWAFFAPDRGPDRAEEPADPTASGKTRAEPPTR